MGPKQSPKRRKSCCLEFARESTAGWTESVLAQGVITGHFSGGYRLGGVELFLEKSPAAMPARPVVALHADEVGEPGERVVVFANPESYTAGANRFEAPFPVVLDARKAYHLLVNLGADPPLAFGLVFPGKTDRPSGNTLWVAQTGSRTLLDTWEWRFNDGFALRMTLYEPGEDLPPPPPRLSQAVAAAPVAAPSGESEDTVGTTTQAESSPQDEIFGSAPAPAPDSSEQTSETVDAVPPPPASGPTSGAIAATAAAPEPSAPSAAETPAQLPPAAPEPTDPPVPILAQNTPQPGSLGR